jgi:hypothetical protein
MREWPTAPEFDVFISYRHREPDQTWVRGQLGPELRRHALKVCLDVETFIPGEPLIRQMEDAVVNSRCTLIVLSSAYLEGRFAHAENIMVAKLGREKAQQRLLAVVLEPCDDGGLRDQARFCLDLTAEHDFAGAMERLIAAIGPPL